MDPELKMLDALSGEGCKTLSPAVKQVARPFTGSTFADGFAMVEKHDANVVAVVIGLKDYADFTAFAVDIGESLQKTDAEGFVGKLWGASIIQTRKVPEGTVWLLGQAGDVWYRQLLKIGA